MKRSTERRILLAILLSSLIPVLALGLLTAGAVLRMGRQAEDISAQARLEQMRSDLHLRCLEKAEDLAAFLGGRADDLRSLALLPRTASSYQSFHWNTLAPLTATNSDGYDERIWFPLYSEIRYLGADGAEVVVVRGGDPVPDTELKRHAGSVAEAPTVTPRPDSLLPQVSIWPVSRKPGSQATPFDGSLELALPLPEALHGTAGEIRVVLDPRHLTARLAPPSAPRSDLPATPGTELRGVFFFDSLGDPQMYPHLSAMEATPHKQLFSDRLPAMVAAVRAGNSGVAQSPGDHPQAVLAYAPILGSSGPAEPPRVLGGFVLAVDLSGLSPTPVTAQAVAALTRDMELQIGALSLASVLFVSLAALFVAQRAARPWVRLREKARTVADAGASDDELGDISRSFDSLASQVAVSAGRLRASKKRLDEFIEMNPDGIAATDPSGHILHCNRALCQMLRRSPSELQGLDVRRLWARSRDWDEMLDLLRVAGRLKSYEGLLQRGDGAEFPALLTLRQQGHGSDESIDLIVRDISDLKEIQRRDRSKTETLFRVYGELSKAHQKLRGAYAEVEEQVRAKTTELRQAYEALQASDRVKTEFLMNMSHELRTPLNCIIGYSEAMIQGLDGPLSEEQAGSLERIADSGRRLLRLIENLLDLSRVEAGRMEIFCIETRLEDAVADVLHQTRSLVRNRPIRLDVALEPSLPAVWADPDRLRQILFNLVGNALKFTERGAVSIHATRLQHGGVEVQVNDTGPGIPREQLDTIFDRFVQLPGTQRAGAGLGLAICREIVENMGGRIRATSQFGSGSTFAFTLATAQPSGQLPLPLPLPDEDAAPQPEK